MIENLKNVLKSITNFDNQELDQISSLFETKLVTKNEILVHEGDICREFYIVSSGSIRIYFIDKDGHEKTRYVLLENYMGTALTSFISQKPSSEFVEALENSELLAIHYSDFFKLNIELNNWKLFYQRILEMAYSFQNRKIETLVTLTAKQRFEQVQNDMPFLINRLSNKVLASYIDIREETLSRLKSK